MTHPELHWLLPTESKTRQPVIDPLTELHDQLEKQWQAFIARRLLEDTIAPGETTRPFTSNNLAEVSPEARYRLSRMESHGVSRFILTTISGEGFEQLRAVIQYDEPVIPPSDELVKIYTQRIQNAQMMEGETIESLPNLRIEHPLVDIARPTNRPIGPLFRASHAVGEAVIHEALQVFTRETRLNYGDKTDSFELPDIDFMPLNLQEATVWFANKVQLEPVDPSNWQLFNGLSHPLCQSGGEDVTQLCISQLMKFYRAGVSDLAMRYAEDNGIVRRFIIFQEPKTSENS